MSCARRAVYRVNIGDTFWSGKGAHKSSEKKQSARRFGLRPQDLPGDGRWARPKQLLLIPHRFAIAMQEAGWLVRNDNVSVKPNPIPDQVRDRCSASHEYVFHFTKSRWYYFNRTPVGRKTAGGGTLPPEPPGTHPYFPGVLLHQISYRTLQAVGPVGPHILQEHRQDLIAAVSPRRIAGGWKAQHQVNVRTPEKGGLHP
jgi:hypothetical protein